MTIVATLVLAAAAVAMAKTEVVVLDDETSAPLSGVEVTGYLSSRLGWQSWKLPPKNAKTTAVTDDEGRCRLSGQTNCGRMGCWVERPPAGYYRPRRGQEVHFAGRSESGVWLPDNLVATIRLDRVVRPIPLFVNAVRFRLPSVEDESVKVTNVVLQFDLLIGDWLPPHGKGKRCDLILSSRLESRAPSEGYVFVNQVEFAGCENGACLCVPDPAKGVRIRRFDEGLKSPFVRQVTLNRGLVLRRSGEGRSFERFNDSNPDRCAAFRIRSERDGEGRLIRAWYGKFYGDVRFEGDDAHGLTTVSFLYYVNPTCLDPNLEWDCRNNCGPVRVLSPEP